MADNWCHKPQPLFNVGHSQWIPSCWGGSLVLWADWFFLGKRSKHSSLHCITYMLVFSLCLGVLSLGWTSFCPRCTGTLGFSVCHVGDFVSPGCCLRFFPVHLHQFNESPVRITTCLRCFLNFCPILVRQRILAAQQSLFFFVVFFFSWCVKYFQMITGLEYRQASSEPCCYNSCCLQFSIVLLKYSRSSLKKIQMGAYFTLRPKYTFQCCWHWWCLSRCASCQCHWH